MLLTSGYTVEDLRECIQWMQPFVSVLHDEVPTPVRDFKNAKPKVKKIDRHNIQVHNVGLAMLVRLLVHVPCLSKVFAVCQVIS